MSDPVTKEHAIETAALWWRVGRHVLRLMDEKNLGLISAGVAFYAILAVFPGIAAVIALWGIFGDPGLALTQLQEFQAVIPVDVYRLLSAQLRALAQTDGLTLGWASILSFGFALWSARAGVAALIRGLNAIYDAPNRSGIAHYIRAFTLTFSLMAVVLIAMNCIVVVPVVLAFFPLGPWAEIGVELVRWIVGVVVLLSGFSLIYRLGPNVPQTGSKMLSAGSIFAAVFWIAASVGFSLYLQNFGTYNEVYGSLGAVIAMLMWLFISAYLVLLGGALNAGLARSGARRATRAQASQAPPATSTP